MLKSQPRTGHTREPDPTHNELKHTITRKTAAHERNQTHLTFTRVIVPLSCLQSDYLWNENPGDCVCKEGF